MRWQRLRRLRHMVRSARHFRGHGVHSPYVYTIVREVIMRGGTPNEQIARLANHCGYKGEGQMLILEPQQSDIKESVTRGRESGTTVVILAPNSSIERRRECQKVMRENPCTTIERFDYIVIFNNHLPKQHFKL